MIDPKISTGAMKLKQNSEVEAAGYNNRGLAYANKSGRLYKEFPQL
jgi:hypothetical protein